MKKQERINRMAEKKRYWLKLEKDFLDSKYIKIIKGTPNGTDYILFYLALMLASVDTVGHLRFTELVAYNEQMLASLTGTNIDIVRSAMKLFQELGMIRILEDGTIFMPEVPRLTGKESESAERVRLFREREKQEALQCNNDVTKCNDNKEKEEDKQRTENREQQEEQRTEEKEFFDNGELNQIFLDFIADRKKRGKKMTDKAIELTVKKLKGFRSDSSRIKAITESIANGWIGIFEPAEDSPKKKYDRTANANFDGLKSGEVDF
jgi:predicted phage replisome organizer